MRSALLLGATGLVGGHCLRLLLEDPLYARVTILARRPVGTAHPKLAERALDFDGAAGDDVFCCLGTTIKKAGSRAAFRAVDHDIPLAVAKTALAHGAKRLFLVSALGADARSTVFYNRIKGELEEALAALPFESVDAFRPALLTGNRREFRLIEKIAEPLMKGLSPLMIGPWRKYRPIAAELVARAMLAAARGARPGRRIHESDRIAELGA